MLHRWVSRRTSPKVALVLIKIGTLCRLRYHSCSIQTITLRVLCSSMRETRSVVIETSIKSYFLIRMRAMDKTFRIWPMMQTKSMATVIKHLNWKIKMKIEPMEVGTLTVNSCRHKRWTCHSSNTWSSISRPEKVLRLMHCLRSSCSDSSIYSEQKGTNWKESAKLSQ